MSTTKTGTGGFSIDGKTYEFDVGDPSAPGIDPVPTDTGDIHVDNSKKDISKKTKDTIGKYLNASTSRNKYAVDPSASEVAVTTNKGVPTPVSPTANSERFVDSTAISLPHDVTSQQRSGTRLFDKFEDPATRLNISKGKTSPQLADGNVVLPQVVGGSPGTLPTGIKPYVSTVLANNRFTDASRSTGAVNLSAPDSGYDPTLVHPKYGDVSMGRLAQVGSALSLRASQELGATGQGNNPTSGGQEAKALLPGFNQLGVSRINTNILEARDVLDSLTTDEIPELTSIAPGGSWGSLNNVDDPFSGITAIGMIALSAALTAAIVVLFEGLGFLLSLIKGGDKTGAAKNNDGRYALGRYTLVQSPDPNSFPPTSFPPDIGSMIGIRGTIHPFSAALQQGVMTFFGIDSSGGLLGQLTSGLISSTENPGYNSVVARSIIRSTLSVIDSFKHAFKSPNLIAGVKNVLSIVDALRSSKLISAMNVFATLGDQVLTEDEFQERVPGLSGEPIKSSRIDNYADDAQGSAVKKNRLTDSLKLAWSSNRSPSSYLIPDPLLTLASVAGKLGAPNIIGAQSPLSRNYFKIMGLTDQVKTALRLPYDSADPTEITVKRVEGLLEAEYMPFYMHDLRTNEIISFHAFITQLSDDFTANWEQTEGYGRVDPVKIYKNTTRRINVGFFIISTSDEDFNDMWLKINKLVSMVYPQYTQGRLLSDADGSNQFTQPFSQLIGASPLIRLRLGDLFRSNYSRFALARLFGADSNVMKLDGDIKFEGANDILKSLADDLKNPTGKTYTLATNNLSKPSEAGGISISLPPIPGTKSGGNPNRANAFNVPPGDALYFLFTVNKELSGNRATVVPQIMSSVLLQTFFGFSSESAASTIKHLKSEYDNSEKPAKRVIGGEYVVPTNDLRVSPDRFEGLVNKGLSSAATNVEKLSEFLNPEKNALVKSFKQTQGKGLAGTIDSLNFDFYNQVTWEIAPNKRAPQFCKVTLAFSPIHDISPGLDHLGHNRAPVYPVGNQAHGPDAMKEGS